MEIFVHMNSLFKSFVCYILLAESAQNVFIAETTFKFFFLPEDMLVDFKERRKEREKNM